MGSFKEVPVNVEKIFKEFCGYIHNEKDKEYVISLLGRIYSSDTATVAAEVSVYWALPFRWMAFGKKIGLPKGDFLKLLHILKV